MEGRKKVEKCNIESNMLKYEEIMPVVRNDVGELINVYRFFESIAKFYGSFPCAICNSENDVTFEVKENFFQIYNSNLNCLNQVYIFEMGMRIVDFLKKIVMFTKDLLCLFDGNKYSNYNTFFQIVWSWFV